VDTGFGFDRGGHPAGDGPSIAQGVSMKHNAVAALALLGLSLSLEGCGGAMGLGVGVVTRTAGTGDAYTAWKASAPPIPPGSGRLLVYAPNRQVSIWTADWATGGEFVFDVDRDVCDVIGSSFAYVDLPAGVHSLSASEIKKFPGGFQIGKYVTMVRIAQGRTTFARIDPVAGAPTLVTLAGPTVRLVVVGNSRAEEEMAKLPLDTHVASFSCKPRAAEDRGT
jgi:hypothetical protein